MGVFENVTPGVPCPPACLLFSLLLGVVAVFVRRDFSLFGNEVPILP